MFDNHSSQANAVINSLHRLAAEIVGGEEYEGLCDRTYDCFRTNKIAGAADWEAMSPAERLAMVMLRAAGEINAMLP
jgi:hypothetical protein